MAVICIDAGTTMIKAVGYDEHGNEAVVVRQETTVTRPQPGWAQQDMESVWDAVVYTVRGVAHELGTPLATIRASVAGPVVGTPTGGRGVSETRSKKGGSGPYLHRQEVS